MRRVTPGTDLASRDTCILGDVDLAQEARVDRDPHLLEQRLGHGESTVSTLSASPPAWVRAICMPAILMDASPNSLP